MGLFDFQKKIAQAQMGANDKMKKLGKNPLFTKQAVTDPDMEKNMQANQPANTYPPVRHNGVASIIENDNAMHGGDDLQEFGSSNASDASLDSDMPQRKGLFDKGNKLGSILAMAIPALYSASQGEGLLLGAAEGGGALAEGNEKKYETDVKNYQAQQDNDLNRTFKKSQIDLAVGSQADRDRAQAETERHNRVGEGKKPDRDVYQEIVNKVSSKDPTLTDGELAWAEAYKAKMEKQGLL